MVELSFIDSNILVFANVKNFPEYEKAVSILEMGLKGTLNLCINTIIALETHYKLVKLINTEEANYRVETLFKSKRFIFFNISKKTIQDGFSIAKQYNLRTNDAVIIASMYENNIPKIYTDNTRDFQKVKNLELINPIRE
ncbi:MAG TPA: PIN domain-containing protein [Candidatus Deferrimicrobium sp.]|nr:PIN domain-containing protein [Candidatus Deferrimicrobium sp.]